MFTKVILLALVLGFTTVTSASLLPVRWTMVNVNAGTLQGDAHFLEMPDGKKILIDACGNEKALISFLKQKNIIQIDQVLLSHLHKDHYGGLLELIAAGIKIKEVRVTVPSEKSCKAESPWGCDWQDVQHLVDTLKKKNIRIKNYKVGETLYKSGSVSIKTLAAFKSEGTPVGNIDVNDTSAVLKLSYGKKSALFTGDLNRPVGEWLAEHSKELKADILKVPHHGTESAAPNTFFDRVSPSIALVPAPTHLWQSERSNRIRNYFEKKKIPTYVNGIDGNVLVNLSRDSIQVDPEIKPIPQID